MIVVDTNVIAYYLIPGPMTELVEDLRKKDSEWSAPILWRSEMRNVFALYLRNGQLDLTRIQEHMADAEALLSGNEFVVESAQVLELAYLSGCTAYDCEFVFLAEKLGVPLLTTDSKLLRSFPQTALSIDQFIKNH